MATLDIPGFASAAEGVALRLDSAHLPGLLRRSLVVPEGCVAWIRDEEGREAVLKPGETRAGTFTGILVKTAEIAVAFQIEALPSQEGHGTTAGIELVLEAIPRAIELKSLLETLGRDKVEIQTS